MFDFENLPERMSKRVVIVDGCWVWTGKRAVNGYGMLWVAELKRDRGAHRLVYEELVNKIPFCLEIDHLCSNRSCVNPAHLEPVTHAENVRRGRNGSWGRARTHCPHGHPLSGDNVIHQRGVRACRECHRIRGRDCQRRWRQANPEMAKARALANYKLGRARLLAQRSIAGAK